MCKLPDPLSKAARSDTDFGRAIAPLMRPWDIKAYDKAGRVPLDAVKQWVGMEGPKTHMTPAMEAEYKANQMRIQAKKSAPQWYVSDLAIKASSPRPVSGGGSSAQSGLNFG